MHRMFLICLLATLGSAAAEASERRSGPPPALSGPREPTPDPFCGPGAAQILILGTYHMNNPGLDAINVNADDVLAPRRQREIEDVVERLARFRPTKIMVEAPYFDRAVSARYREYRAGRQELGRDETEQIGFRLAARLNLPTVIPVDFPMRMSGLRPDEVDDNWRPRRETVEQPGQTPVPPATSQSQPSAEDRRLRATSVREFLLPGNEPQAAEKNHSRDYMELLLPEDSADIYARSNYLANWYRRNFRIFANIARATTFPSDRVLVIMGQGHLKILRDLARDADYFCLSDASGYLR